jgi:hypothetical protein
MDAISFDDFFMLLDPACELPTLARDPDSEGTLLLVIFERKDRVVDVFFCFRDELLSSSKEILEFLA